MKNAIKDSLFLLIFALLFYMCSNVFILKGNGYGSDVVSFYDLPKQSLDIMFFGSSHSYSTFSPHLIEEKTGLKSYNFATQQQPVYITYYYMIEALKTQKPKYFVLDTLMFSFEEEYASEGVIRDALDRMKLSVNKIEAINTNVVDKETRKAYYINLIKYHSRYKDLHWQDFKQVFGLQGIDNKGFIGLPQNNDIYIDNSVFLKNTESKEITSKNKEYLMKIIELANDNGVELIFVKTPCALKKETFAYLNRMKEYANEYQLDYIDYNRLFTELDLQPGDFFDEGHLSESGAKKVSLHFADYIKEKNK